MRAIRSTVGVVTSSIYAMSIMQRFARIILKFYAGSSTGETPNKRKPRLESAGLEVSQAPTLRHRWCTRSTKFASNIETRTRAA